MEEINFLDTPLRTLSLGAVGVVVWELGKTLVSIMQAAGKLAVAWIELKVIAIQIPDDSTGAEG